MAMPTIEFKQQLLEALNNGGEKYQEADCARMKNLLNEAGVQHVTFHVDCSIGAGVAPLHVAAINACSKCIQLLLDKGAIINCLDEGHRSVLYYAVKNAPVNAVKCLLSNGADDTMTDNNGFLPLHIACILSDAEIVALLLE